VLNVEQDALRHEVARGGRESVPAPARFTFYGIISATFAAVTNVVGA
jgi:hypothetical protein